MQKKLGNCAIEAPVSFRYIREIKGGNGKHFKSAVNHLKINIFITLKCLSYVF